MAELRFIQDFPAKGVKFIDISPKLTDKNDFKAIIDEMGEKIYSKNHLAYRRKLRFARLGEL